MIGYIAVLNEQTFLGGAEKSELRKWLNGICLELESYRGQS